MLLTELRNALRKSGNPVKATAMQAYMKSAMPYHGVPAPLLRQVCREIFSDVGFDSASDWRAQVLSLWRNARFREERYAALYLSGDKRARDFQTPGAVRRKMLAWSKCNDLWKRRSSILCQLGSKDQADLELLYTCIAPSMESREFFLQKAIGWALRQYARTDPGEIRRYIQLNQSRLSALSRREALKHL